MKIADNQLVHKHKRSLRDTVHQRRKDKAVMPCSTLLPASKRRRHLRVKAQLDNPFLDRNKEDQAHQAFRL